MAVNSPGILLFVHSGCSSNFFKLNSLFMMEFIISLIVYLVPRCTYPKIISVTFPCPLMIFTVIFHVLYFSLLAGLLNFTNKLYHKL